MTIRKTLFLIKEYLIKHHETISTCESASGGNLSSLLTSIDGSSNYYLGSFISYANEIKEKIVGIDKNIIDTNGAVSEITASYMALNTNKKFNTDWCISITGNASRNNLIENKKSCEYYIGFAHHNQVDVIHLKLKSYSRKFNQKNVAKEAIKLFYKKLQERL